MKHRFALLFFFSPLAAAAQFGISYHQSSLPFVGISYEIKDRFRPEVRLGTDLYLEDVTLEGVLVFDILNREDYELYGGGGVNVNGFSGLVIPLGVNFYPLTSKKFGCHIELSPILGEDDILRGSWGIRYRFLKEKTD